MEGIRLQKYIAEAGIASRRKAEELIREGKVKVNGRVVVEMGEKVSSRDVVEVDGVRATLEDRKVYIMLNKPAGCITSSKDQFSRKTVMDLVLGVKERIFPVGRLDYDTSGLLLLTNDGKYTHMLTHPSHEVSKTYAAVVEGKLDAKDILAFRNGLAIEDYTTSPAELKILKEERYRSVVEITIHEGRNRQVRKMCSAIGHPVISLKRTAIGRLKLGTLKEGEWRYLDREELKLVFAEKLECNKVRLR